MNAEQLAAEARTVTQLAIYLDELKTSARELAERIAPQERGYFTPTEDEATRGLLVSYCQTRAALFDVIHAYRDLTELSVAAEPAAFLTAFAAAALLVDSARFLREIVHHRPVVRRKLNEPAPEFGIPGGVYDEVQKSLVSSRNAWHLYYAAQYFEQHQAEFRELGLRDDLAPVLRIAEKLQSRLDVSVLDFAKAKLRTRTSQLLRRLGRSVFVRSLYGLQKLGGRLVADKYVVRGHAPGLPTEVAQNLRSLLRPGDVLVVRKEYALTNYFLPGYWPHAALYLGDATTLEQLARRRHPNVTSRWSKLHAATLGESPRVLEAMKDGVQIRPLVSPFSADSVVVLRPLLNAEQVAEALARVLVHEGKPYDFDFDFRRSDRLVCTEVVYRAYDGIGGLSLPLTTRAGRPTLSGGDLIGLAIAGRHFEPAAVFAPAFFSAVATGTDAVKLLEAGS